MGGTNLQTGLKNGVNMNLTYQQEQGLEPMPSWYKPPVAAKSTYPPGTVYKHADGYYADPVIGGNVGSGGSGFSAGYAGLAAAAQADRAAVQARADARESKVTGGYDKQISASRLAGQQGYDRLEANYAGITADALSTRERNMARVDQYGASMRSDLDIKNQQAIAAARQSSVQRGLGNTTIQDSMVRGQNFDNNRQMMSLEDQLLQNRISTDSNLSKTYQDTLQSRAQGLASQWNQNISNDNQLASNKLGYIGSIVEPDNYRDISSIYLQGLQEQNANQQAQLQRDNANQQAEYDRQLQRLNTPAKFRFINGVVQKSTDNGHTWQTDADRPGGGSASGRGSWL